MNKYKTMRDLLFRFMILWVFMIVPIHVWSIKKEPIRVLVLSGANNHDWRTTTPYLEQLLNKQSDICFLTTDRPDTLNARMLTSIDVIVSNWNTFPENNTVWNRESKEALEVFIRKGGGWLTIHAGSCSAYDWDFFWQLTSGRWGKETHHGAISDFEVTVTRTHPITESIQSFRFRDELWENVEWNPNVEVLATAQSTSGKEEPVLAVTQIDRGRGCILLLGHDVEIMRQPMFNTLFIRAVYWTAHRLSD